MLRELKVKLKDKICKTIRNVYVLIRDLNRTFPDLRGAKLGLEVVCVSVSHSAVSDILASEDGAGGRWVYQCHR